MLHRFSVAAALLLVACGPAPREGSVCAHNTGPNDVTCYEFDSDSPQTLAPGATLTDSTSVSCEDPGATVEYMSLDECAKRGLSRN